MPKTSSDCINHDKYWVGWQLLVKSLFCNNKRTKLWDFSLVLTIYTHFYLIFFTQFSHGFHTVFYMFLTYQIHWVKLSEHIFSQNILYYVAFMKFYSLAHFLDYIWYCRSILSVDNGFPDQVFVLTLFWWIFQYTRSMCVIP